MSANGLDVFDRTLQTTHIWLDELMEELGCTREVAWHTLGAVLRTLRDRLPVELAAHLGAQLPLLVRGLYYDQWRPADTPTRFRTMDDFVDCIAEGLEGTRPVDPLDAATAVFQTLSRHISEGQVAKIQQALPAQVRLNWASVCDDVIGPDARAAREAAAGIDAAAIVGGRA